MFSLAHQPLETELVNFNKEGSMTCFTISPDVIQHQSVMLYNFTNIRSTSLTVYIKGKGINVDESRCDQVPVSLMVGVSMESIPHNQCQPFCGLLRKCEYIDQEPSGALRFNCLCLEDKCNFMSLYIPRRYLIVKDVHICEMMIKYF